MTVMFSQLFRSIHGYKRKGRQLSRSYLSSSHVMMINIFLFTLISDQKTSLHRFLWANVLSQLAVV